MKLLQTEKDPIPEEWEGAEGAGGSRVSRGGGMMPERRPPILNGDQAEKNLHE